MVRATLDNVLSGSGVVLGLLGLALLFGGRRVSALADALPGEGVGEPAVVYLPWGLVFILAGGTLAVAGHLVRKARGSA